MRAEGGGPNHRLPFTDRVIATLVIMRLQLPHAALAVFYQVDRSTLTRAVNEIRPLLADRGLAVPGKPGVRLKTLADVFAYAAAEGVELRIDATQVQVRRPAAHKPGRRAFVSGKQRHLGFVNPAIYQIARSSHYHQAVHDATAGNSNTAEFPTGRSPATGHPSTAVAGVDLLNAACGRAGSGSAAQFVLDCPADPRR